MSLKTAKFWQFPDVLEGVPEILPLALNWPLLPDKPLVTIRTVASSRG